jgi:hypothetical protein
MHAAMAIGLRDEVEHCAAVMIQSVCRAHEAQVEKALAKAVLVIQRCVRRGRKVMKQNKRANKMLHEGKEEMRAKAKEKLTQQMQVHPHAWLASLGSPHYISTQVS